MKRYCTLFFSLLCALAFCEQYPVTGTLYPHLTTKVSSQVSGRVEEVIVQVGDHVKKGEALVKLDPCFYEIEFKKAQTALELAAAIFEEATIEFTRMQNLWEKKEGEQPSISKKQFDEAHFRYKQKQSLLNQALLDVELTHKRLHETEIVAPYSGVVTKRYVDPGEAVSVIPVVHLVEIVDMSQLTFEFSLPQKMAPYLTPGATIEATIEGYPGTLQAKVETICPEIDVASRSFKCKAVINNEKLLLKPGSYVAAKIHMKK